MYLKVQDRNGRAYLSVAQSYRQGGKVRTRTIENIGYADAFANVYDDPIAHFREHVEQLNLQQRTNRQRVEFAFERNAEINPLPAPPARLGAAIALGCLDAIGVRGFFQARAGREGFPTHVGRVFEMLAAERMMHAASKRETWTARVSFPRRCDLSLEDLYAALPCFAHEETHLAEHLARTWDKARGPRDSSCIYLACGRYSFPWNGAQSTDEAHACAAVALDAFGMPAAYHVVEGKLDGRSLVQAADLLKARLGAERAVVIVGTRWQFDSFLRVLAEAGHGFVLYQADADATPGLSEWIEDSDGYRESPGNVQMKARLSERALGDNTMPVKEVVLRGGGYSLQHGKAVLVSSETDLDGADIAQLFRELWRQAEPFQPLEADFSAMPVAVSVREHVHAHFAICYAAFSALRALRRKVGWQHNAAAVADALLRMEGTHLQRNYYLFNYRSQVTDDIEAALDLPCALRLRTRADLRAVPATVSRALLE